MGSINENVMISTSGNRLVDALRRVPTDRVPIFEHVIDERFVRHAIGLDKRSLDLDAEPLADLCRFMHMDVMTLGYRSRVEGTRMTNSVVLESSVICGFGAGLRDSIIAAHCELRSGDPVAASGIVLGDYSAITLG